MNFVEILTYIHLAICEMRLMVLGHFEPRCFSLTLAVEPSFYVRCQDVTTQRFQIGKEGKAKAEKFQMTLNSIDLHYHVFESFPHENRTFESENWCALPVE